ncbi:MAG: chorismate lyase [Betaproteobacteria bacterium]|nr:chorismate lyase [Betaproteobacteria bacterium]
MIECGNAGVWRSALARSAENAAYLPWLRDRGSLTVRIQARGHFAVRVLRQGLARPTRDEAALLGIRASALVRVREVALLCNGAEAAFAHTVLPCRPRGPLTRWLARLGNRSLGSLLFSHARFARGEMGFKRLDVRHPLFTPASQVIGGSQKVLWARRSLFRFAAQSALVTEVFSPALCCR